ncbi:MAG: flagellar hook capping FlgD N-terminal domain-containing protein [Rhodobacterales bacterium]
MDAIDAVTASSQPAQAKAAARSVIGSDFETFLKMLTTQLKNQDPLNPMDSSDFAVQLATFSSVEQQVLTNELLTGLSGQMGQVGLAQLATWVGMEARAATPVQFGGFPVTVHPAPLATADAARLSVHNEDGILVQSMPIPVSSEPYVWTGRDATGQSLPNGVYRLTVESLSLGQVVDSTTPETYSRIQEARIDAGATILVMENGAMIDAALITALRE